MSLKYIGTVVMALTLVSAVLPSNKRALPSTDEKATPPRVLRIGAVAYAPSAVTVFENLRRYFARNDLPVDYVLYSNYDALVDALRNGHVDIAWNTPLAHARYHLLCNGQSQTLVMRDVDCNFRCKLLVLKDSGIKDLASLQ
jgi:phosphonate transport system substrate-binding protein